MVGVQGQVLSVKDARILEELEQNARQSFASIGKRVGLSKQVVSYRVQQLLKNGVISRFVTIVDVQKLGYSFYNVLFELKAGGEKKEQEMITFLRSLPEVSWLVNGVGTWNLIVSILAKDMHEFNNCINTIQDNFHSVIQRSRLNVVLDALPCRRKYLLANPITTYRETARVGDMTRVMLSDTEKNVLRLLKLDTRMPAMMIAKEANLSYDTVKAKMKKLRDDGVIQQFTAKVNPLAYGYEWYMLFIELEQVSQDKKDRFVAFLREHSHCVYITNFIGRQNVMLDMHVKNMIELKKIMDEIQEKFENIVKTYESMLVVKEHDCTFIPAGVVRTSLVA